MCITRPLCLVLTTALLSSCVSVDLRDNLVHSSLEDLMEQTTFVPGEGEKLDPILITLSWDI